MNSCCKKKGTTIASLSLLICYVVVITWKEISILSLAPPPLMEGGAPPPSTNNETATRTSRAADFLTFTRIPKTGSTSLLAFLRDSSGMESLNSLVDNPDPQPGALKCMFAPLKHNDTETRIFALNECGHFYYNEIRRSFFRVTGLSSPFTSTRDDVVVHISMVRDPFDRLRSLFDYMHEHVKIEAWKEFNTEAQYDRVRVGDFSGWLNLVHSEQKIPVGAQYAYIDDDIDKAISLITGDPPDVLVLVNECFESSLRLTENKLSLKAGAVDDFLTSSNVRSNVSKGRNATESASFDELRKQSKRYFPQEYKFYNAAVEQFKRQLSSLDPSLPQTCDL